MARPQLTEHSNSLIKRSLIDAAYAVCLDEGEQNLSLRKVAQRANVSHTYVYRYFPDRDSLIAHVRVRCFGDLYAFIQRQDDPSQTPVARIKTTLNSMHQYAIDNPHNYSLMYDIDQPAQDEYPELAAVRHELFGFATALSLQASEQGAIDMDYLEFTHLAWATFHGLISLDATHNFNLGKDIEELKQSAWRLFFKSDFNQFQGS